MPSNRKIVFSDGQYYHVYNRGVEKRPVFTNKSESLRAIGSINFYRFGNLSMRYSKYLSLEKQKRYEFLESLNKIPQQVKILAFCLMENHFHFLLKQLEEGGIVKFMAKFQNSYTKFFNTKHRRVGPLFQGVFKGVHIEDDEQLIHVSRYIHLNPVMSFYIKAEELTNYRWSSYQNYLGITETQMVDPSEIMSFFKDQREYIEFVLDQIDYAKQFKKIEHLTID